MGEEKAMVKEGVLARAQRIMRWAKVRTRFGWRTLEVSPRLTWAGVMVEQARGALTTVEDILHGWLPRPAQALEEKVPEGDPLGELRWKLSQRPSEGLLDWAARLGDSLGIPFEGETWGELLAFLQGLEGLRALGPKEAWAVRRFSQAVRAAWEGKRERTRRHPRGWRLREADLIREASAGGRELLEEFLFALVDLVTVGGEVDWLDPARLFRAGEEAFRHSLEEYRRRGDLTLLRPVAAAALGVHIQAQKERAGMWVGRPLSDGGLRLINLAWGYKLVPQAGAEFVPPEEILLSLREKLRPEDLPLLQDEVALAELEEYVLRYQGRFVSLDTPVEGAEGVLHGEVIPVEVKEEEEVNEEEEAVRSTLRQLVEELAKEGFSHEEARAKVAVFWAVHALGVPPQPGRLGEWVRRRGLPAGALPAGEMELLELLSGLRERFEQVYITHLAREKGWVVR